MTTTEQTVHREYDGHGVLVYRPVSRSARYKPRHARRAHHRARHGHSAQRKRKYSRKRHHRRRAAHARYRHHKAQAHRRDGRYRYPPVLPAYHPEPSYEYSAHQPAQVYVVKRRRAGRIHKKIPLFGSKTSYRRKTVRVRHRKHRHRRVCSPCGHVSYKKTAH